MRRSAIIRDGVSFIYCRQAVCGEYYYPVAKMHQIPDELETNVTNSIIVRLSDRRWIVTTKNADESNVHSIRFECVNLANAQEMRG